MKIGLISIIIKVTVKPGCANKDELLFSEFVLEKAEH